MSSALVCGIVLLILALGYKFYGSYVEQRIIECDDSRETPAHTMRDDIDYVPTKPIILFGHHFSSIAGAGPIVGPILGLFYFGWAVTLAWIAVGSVFAGAVHDYLALMISARQQGRSMADISGHVISPRASVVFSIFLWAALILVIAAFGAIGAKSLIAKPAMVFPTFMLIPIAMIFGWAVRRTGLPVWLGTILAVGLNFVFIYVGHRFVPLSVQGLFPDLVGQIASAEAGGDAELIALAKAALEAAQVRIWFPILMGYCVIASLLPVWLLMQPRDYICVYKLFIGLGLGMIAVMIANEGFKTEAFKGVVHAKGGPIWPMLMVIVACGAISGFHSVVAGGTTVKQLRSEKDGKPIAFGGMVLEGVLALLTVCLVGAGLMWAPGSPAEYFAPDLIKTSPLLAFSNGFGRLVGGRLLPFIGIPLCALFGMVMLKTFVLTSLDTCTRLARFVVHELVGERVPLLRGRLVGTVLTIGPAFYLGFSGSYTKIWPIFGAANQLIAALALIVAACYLLGSRRPSLLAAIPAVVMLFTTVAALLLTAGKFLFPAAPDAKPDYALGGLAIGLAILGFYVAVEGVFAVPKLLRRAREEPEPAPAGGE